MLTVTENARQKVKEVLAANVGDPEACFRLVPGDRPGRFDLVVDREKPGDQVVEHQGAKVLLVAVELSGALEGVTIDLQETTEGPRLVMSKE